MQKTTYLDTEIFWCWTNRLDVGGNSKDDGRLLTFGPKKKVDVEPFNNMKKTEGQRFGGAPGGCKLETPNRAPGEKSRMKVDLRASSFKKRSGLVKGRDLRAVT